MTNQENKQESTQAPMPPPYPYYAPPPEDEINLMDLWKVLVEQKIIIFIITTIITLAALTYAFLATPIYRAEALLAPVSKGKASSLSALANQFGGLASLAGVNLGDGGSDIEEIIAILKTREFINKFIKDENLMPILFINEWDKNNKQWVNKDKPPSLWDAYKKFTLIMTVKQNKKTGLLTLAIEWEDPVLAVKWIGDLINRLNVKLRSEAILETEESIKYLKAELQKTSIIEIKESIYSLIETQTKTKMLANTQKEYAFRILDKAVVPEEKIKPNRRLIVILGFVLGGMMGIFVAFFRSFIISKTKSSGTTN